MCHSTLCAYTDVEHVHFRRVVPAFGTVFLGTASVAWIKRAGQLAADDVAWTLWVQSPLGPRHFVGFFVGYRPFPATREKQYEYLCMYACVYVYMHIRIPACLSPCTSRMRLQWYCPIFTVRRITSNTNMVYAKTHFTIRSNIQKYVCVSLWLPVAKSALPTGLLICICSFNVICVIGGRCLLKCTCSFDVICVIGGRCLLICICSFDVICVIGGRAMSVIMCMVFVCCVRKIKH